MPAGILVIDDDAATMQQVQLALTQDGYEVFCAQSGVNAIRKMLVEEPDLVILGINSQEKDWEFCRRLLTFGDRPLLLLLSTKSHLDRVKGLELGADDCMMKPILSIELVARTRALLRRSTPQASVRQSLFVDGDLIVDPTRKEVQVHDQLVALTPIEFRILVCFTRHVGEVLSHEQLLAEVWGPNHVGGRDLLKLYVHNLRQKIESNPHRPQRILTRRGEGYVFERLAGQR
jgi:DNA-binding response OmpR family regulator